MKDDLEAALAAAARHGARGEWYSGDHVAGQHAVLPKPPSRGELHRLPTVRAWTREAMALDSAPGAVGGPTPRRADPTAKRSGPSRPAERPRASPAKSTTAKTSSAAKPATKKPSSAAKPATKTSRAAKPTTTKKSRAAKPATKKKGRSRS